MFKRLLSLCSVFYFSLFISILAQANDTYSSVDSLVSNSFKLQMDSGQVCIKNSDYPKALKHYFSALKLAKKSSNNLGIAQAESALGTAYYRLSEYENALKHLKLAEEDFTKLNSNNELANVYYKIGIVYRELPKKSLKKKALFYYRKALNIYVKEGNCIELADVYNGFAGYYYMQQQLDSVEYYAKLALEKFEECGSPQEQAAMYINIAALLNSQDNYNEAVIYNKKGIGIAQKNHIISQLAQGYKNLSETYSYKNDYENAYKNVLTYIQYKDSLVSAEKNRAVAELTILYETQEKEQQIILQQEKLKNRNLLLWFLGIFSVLGFIVTFVIYRLWQSRNKQNQHLAKLNRTKDKLFSIISHDLKSPAIAQKTAMDSLKPEIEKIDNQMLKSGYDILHENVTNQVSIINNMMDWARVQTDNITYKPQTIDVINIVKEEVKLYNVAVEQKGIQLHLDLPESCIVFADRQMIAIVVRNLINNAVKFTKEKGNIIVKCHCKDGEAIVCISDDGVGMSQQQINALYTSEQRIEVGFGTKGEKGTGLGLILCKDLLERNGSRLLIDSKPQKGTSMRFSLRKTIKR